ncbi:hypothetical protein, partial [Pseudomonas viridiflava]|uniref:hypothetical protein n=1 Tax=Pseudomonas viridiflava TaxID=33069 RepID=UPI0019D2B29B
AWGAAERRFRLLRERPAAGPRLVRTGWALHCFVGGFSPVQELTSGANLIFEIHVLEGFVTAILMQPLVECFICHDSFPRLQQSIR